MNAKKFSEAMGEIDSKYIEEAIRYQQTGRKSVWMKWGVSAACLCLLFLGGLSLTRLLQNSPFSAVPPELPPIQGQTFVSVSSLLAEESAAHQEMSLETALVPVEPYQGIYVKTTSVDSDTLSQSMGAPVSGTETWRLISGHTDLQYLIQKEDRGYSLWKFLCFDSDQYPYRDVLELIYQIDSSEQITEVQVNPATMDNTDVGKSIQAEIGTHTVTNKNEVEILYRILSSLTCCGPDNWDKIPLGNNEAAADEDASTREAVRLGRGLTLMTSEGLEIDGLKYTAFSHQFYEYFGIAYHPLSEDDAARVCEILHMERDEAYGNAPSQEPEESTAAPTADPPDTRITLAYITDLQSRISNAMMNQELPFVTSSAVYENPYRLHIVVSSNAEEDFAKLMAFDTAGGALEIEYSDEPNAIEE